MLSTLARKRAKTASLRVDREARTQERHAVNLTARVSNCLQTILELEPDLERLRLGHILLREFNVLKSFLTRLEDVRIDENDVLRIEAATENFLRELKAPLARADGAKAGKYILH